MRRFMLVAGLALAVILGSASTPAPANASDYTLTASGTWRSNDGVLNGTWTAKFDVAGFDLNGTLNILGMPGVGEGNIAGSWDAQNIGFGVLFLEQELASFTGGFDGKKFTGSFEKGNMIGSWSGLLSSIKLSTENINPIISSNIPTLLLSQGSGSFGDLVGIAAKLYSVGQQITKVENTINFDLNTPILATSFGTPDCSVNPLVDADAFFEFLPKGCSGTTCTQVRAVVNSLSALPIPDGARLYTCKARIAAQAATGIYQLVSSALKALDVHNIELPISQLAGTIAVKDPISKKFGSCHCSTVDQAGAMPWASLAAPLALLVMRRRSRKQTAL